jgi:hypothetical protein
MSASPLKDCLNGSVGEYLEMPGLHVRLEQVQRLCGLGRTAYLPGMKGDACYPLLKKRLED